MTEQVAISFQLHGRIPTKKNSKFWTGKRLITKPEYQAIIGGLVLQARGAWHGAPPLSKVWLRPTFQVSHLRQDLDGAFSTLLDVLKDAGVIVDDNMKHVVGFDVSFTVVPKGHEGVFVVMDGTEAAKSRAA